MISKILIFVFLAKPLWAVPSPRIFNGTLARPREFPYMITLQYNRQHDCGGSILSNSHVVTAAHCLHGKTGLRLIAGEHSHTNFSGDEQVREVQDYWIHENYTGQPAADIAVVKVKRPFVFNEAVQLIGLSDSAKYGETGVVCGWGFVNSSTMPDILQKTRIKVQSHEDCENSYNRTWSSNLLCAGTMTGSTSMCSADSGSPLAVDGTLVGVLSSGPALCGSPPTTHPDIFVKVAAFKAWIESKLQL